MKPGTIGIVGMGEMGRGIAQVCATSGYKTVWVKSRQGTFEGPRRALAESLDRSMKKGKITQADLDESLERLELTGELDALAECDLVIETVVEDLDVKRDLLREMEGRVSVSCVITSNTSSLPVSALAEALANPARFLGLHFFSPVPAMKLVEIAPTPQTYPSAVERCLRFVEHLGKTPVVVSNTSGYIVNRLLVPYLLDGISALEQRIAPARAIDTAMKLGCGHPMGPLELADAIGLDIVYAMARTLHAELSDRRYSPPALLRRLVQLGHLGKKTGRGLFDYTGGEIAENADLWPAVGA